MWTFIVLAGVGDVFDLMMKVTTALIVVIAIGFSLLFGWMVRRMMSDDIRGEVVAPLRKEDGMETLSQVLFWVGLLSIPLSWLVWFFGPQIEVGRHVLSKITDPALQAALKEAHAERWGIFVGLWPATLLVLSFILEKKI